LHWEQIVMNTPSVTRRSTLALLGASAAAGSWPRVALAATAARPWLATPAQIAGEKIVLALQNDPEVKRLQARIRAELAETPRAQTIPDALISLDGAIAQWTRSLTFAQLAKNTARPSFLWATDDSPRQWLGYELGGVGTSGDNPDAIYRTAGIEGGGRYEIVGQYHPDSRPTQLLIEVHATDIAKPSTMMTPTASGKTSPDPQSAAQINQDQLVVDAQGRFRITLGGEPGGPNHLSLPPLGFCTVGVRDILADWKLRPAALTIKRLDKVPAARFGLAEVRKLVLEDLGGYIGFWSNFPNIWFQGLKPNTRSEPQQRPGGWGFVAGLNYHLAEGEGLLVTTDPAGAKYTGFQINDPWMIQPDTRIAQVSLNGSQVTPNADGTVTYVIAPTDPGVANWLDTTGYRDGLAIIRWQAIPAGLKGDNLIREFRVIKLSELSALDVPKVTPAERKVSVAARRGDYETRVR
jgi:hypothetical protein